MPIPPDLHLATLARRQHGAFSRIQAIACGVDRREVSRRVASGRWRRLLPGVMAEAGTPDTWELRAMAALLAVGGEVVLSRQSAARLHGLDLPPGTSHDLALLVQDRTFPTLPAGITIHRTRRLSSEDVGMRSGFPLTTPARTICDLAGQVGPVAIRRTIADAVRKDLTDPVDLRATLGRLGRIRGKRNVLRVCDELSPLEADCRSELESSFVRLMTRMGLPPTAMNQPVVDVNGVRRFIDAVYLPWMLPIELDSRAHHGTAIDANDDTRRENAILPAGWETFRRFTWWDIRDRPGYVVDTISAALVQAAERRDLSAPPRLASSSNS